MTRRALPSFSLALLVTLLVAPAACGESDTSPEEGGGTTSRAGDSGFSGAPDVSEGGAVSGGGTTNGGAPAGGRPSAAGESSTDAGAGGNDELGQGGARVCGAVEKQEALAAGVHVTDCTPIVHATNPPSSGEHYPTWADFGEYDFALPRGFWVHNLEHGAVVVTYRCDDGCEEDLSAARAWLASLEPDAGCDADGRARVLLLPDPLLDVRWAASAWGHTLRADCFDAGTFSAFYVAHAGQPPAPEASLCGTGFDFRLDGVDTCGAK